MKKINLTITTVSALGFGLLVFASAGVLTANAQVATLSPQTLPDGTVGVSYSETISATSSLQATTTGAIPNSSAFDWSLTGTLPPGLSLNTANTGASTAISGTPTTAGQYSFTISGLSNGSTSMQTYTMNVDANTNTQASSTTTNTTTTTTSTSITTGPTTATSALEVQLDDAQTELMELETQLSQESSSNTGSGSADVNPGGPMIPATPAGPVFGRDLTIGSVGADVTALQEFLNQNGYPITATGPGSAGNETDYFGTLTQAALASYQAANGISPAQGYYGPITRAKIGAQLVSLSSSSSTTTTTSSTTQVPY